MFHKTSGRNNTQYLPSNRTRCGQVCMYTRTCGLVRFYLRARARAASTVCRYVCPSIMATITRSVHSISFFLCLPRLFQPSVLATVLGSSRSARICMYYAMLTLFPLSNVHRVSSFALRASGMVGRKEKKGVTRRQDTPDVVLVVQENSSRV